MPDKLDIDKSSVDLLKCVEKIALSAKDSEINDEFLSKNDLELSALAGFLGISRLQTAIFCVVLNLNFGKQSVDLDEIAGYIGCSPISILSSLPELDEMASKKIICRNDNSRRRRRGSYNINNIEFYINRNVLDSLGKGETFKEIGRAHV